MNALKIAAAIAALDYIEDDTILGIGTGSTVNAFIDALAPIKHKINACVASSNASAVRLKTLGIAVIDLNVASDIPLYIDGADEVNPQGEMIKGGGGALTREKILATVASTFICLVDESKVVKRLGRFPVAVEVLPMARSYVARQIVQLGGDPQYRQGFITDNGNIIIDIYNLDIPIPISMEQQIKAITGVIDCGIFAKRTADKVLIARHDGVHVMGE